MFIWTSIAHLALPLGEAGIGEVPNESAVLSAMQRNIGDQTGLYIFPALGVGKNATRQEKNEAMKQIAAKAASGPSGILMYHPTRAFTFGKWMGIEFGTELLEAILVVCSCSPKHALRVSPVESASCLLPGSWQRWPRTSPFGTGTDSLRFISAATWLIQIVGFLCVGIVAALVLRKASV